jgi:hypothetical protein
MEREVRTKPTRPMLDIFWCIDELLKQSMPDIEHTPQGAHAMSSWGVGTRVLNPFCTLLHLLLSKTEVSLFVKCISRTWAGTTSRSIYGL